MKIQLAIKLRNYRACATANDFLSRRTFLSGFRSIYFLSPDGDFFDRQSQSARRVDISDRAFLPKRANRAEQATEPGSGTPSLSEVGPK